MKAVPVPGGGSGGPSAPSLNLAAPITPQAQTTNLSQQSINAVGNAANRAYVLETDVSNNQERIRRLNRAARIN
jgi:ribosomal protein S13